MASPQKCQDVHNTVPIFDLSIYGNFFSNWIPVYSFADGREPCHQSVKTLCWIHGEHFYYRFYSLSLDGGTG